MFLVIWCACVLDWWFHGFCLKGWILKHANACNASEFNRFFLANRQGPPMGTWAPYGSHRGCVGCFRCPWPASLHPQTCENSSPTKMLGPRVPGTDWWFWMNFGVPGKRPIFWAKLFGNDSPPSDDWRGTSHRIQGWVKFALHLGNRSELRKFFTISRSNSKFCWVDTYHISLKTTKTIHRKRSEVIQKKTADHKGSCITAVVATKHHDFPTFFPSFSHQSSSIIYKSRTINHKSS